VFGSFSTEYLTVMLDGRIVGGVPVSMGPFLVQRLRYLKVKSLEGVSDRREREREKEEKKTYTIASSLSSLHFPLLPLSSRFPL
jgi:hypothetical protein